MLPKDRSLTLAARSSLKPFAEHLLRILLVHNEYGKVSGEEIVVNSMREVLEENGHQISDYTRASAELAGSPLGQAKAFFTGIYNFSSRLIIRDLLRRDRPDIVHVHNLFPLISPSVLGECRRAGVPVVMTVHNYRLVCPNGLHMVKGRICEKCVGGREYHCVLNRCEGGLLKSTGYAIRNAFARKMRFFHRNVTIYAALTEFQRGRLIDAGFPPDRVLLLPNMIDDRQSDRDCPLGDWVGFVGRVSPEKGIPTLLAAAAALPDVKFKIAGAYDRMADLVKCAPANIEFVSHLGRADLEEFYRRSRIIVLCSTWFEGFPMVLAEAMFHEKPVICSRIGGLPEIVEDGITGVLFTPGSDVELARQIRQLWSSPVLCRQMGQAGREKALRQYSRNVYYDRLIHMYRKAASLAGAGSGAHIPYLNRTRRHN